MDGEIVGPDDPAYLDAAAALREAGLWVGHAPGRAEVFVARLEERGWAPEREPGPGRAAGARAAKGDRVVAATGRTAEVAWTVVLARAVAIDGLGGG